MQKLLQQTTAIARAAGAAILEIYQQAEIVVSSKDDNSPLTQADLAAHRLICTELAQISTLPILSEESAAIPWQERQTWSRYWLIDPLDGTKEFIKRNGEFTVNIALIDGHQAVLGVVYAPVLQRLYFAAQGQGAWRQDQDSAPQPIRVAKREHHSWRVVGSRSHQTAANDDFLQYLGAVDMVAMGSSLKLCLVAEGAADLYPRFGLTSEWDTAAAQCVVEQAGGVVCDTHLNPLPYNNKESILNPEFVVAADLAPAWSGFFKAPT